MKVISSLFAALLVASPAFAQRDAVSAGLSPEAAGEIFKGAVVDACVPAVSGSGVSALSAAQRGKLQPTNDAETRRQAGAGPDETVWDVVEGKGVVTVRERAGRCVVSVYGPTAAPTLMSVAQGLTGEGFERFAGAGGGISQTLSRAASGKRVMVQLNGSEPGMPGHQSRFSVVTATVFVAQ